MFQEQIDKLLTYFNEKHEDALKLAREEYGELVGKVHEDDSFYEERIQLILIWFLLERPFNEEGRHPIDIYADTIGYSLPQNERETIRRLREAEKGIFEILKLKPKQQCMILFDLFERRKIKVTERRSLVGYSKGAIFEGYLVKKGDDFFLLDSLTYYPPIIKPALVKKLKELRKSGVESIRPFLMHLQKLWMQHKRYSHVDPKRIFSEENFNAFETGGLSKPK